jgi:predicted dehydrogenase
MKVGIIGCGLIGNKRALAIHENKDLEIIAAADLDLKKAKSLTDKFGGKPFDNSDAVLNSKADIVVIATIHDQLATLALKAAKAGKHILVEKPAARNSSELTEVQKIVKQKNLKVEVGFNHRFHPAFLKAKELIDNNDLGELYFIRAWYGHGGRLGYENEWRFNKEISGGGELLDQGIHLIDLSKLFLGSFTKISGVLPNYFWGDKNGVEDNCFMLLGTDKNQTASLHATWTEWKNTFVFEITGKLGKISINGLGGSYGTEQIAFYKMLPQMGPPKTTIWQFPFADTSWDAEIKNLVNAIKTNTCPMCTIDDAIETLKIIEELYKQGGRL